MHRTGERIPLWLDEGFAEFYQNTEIRDDETRLGQVDAYYPEFLQRNQLLPLATLFAVDQHSPYYHEQDKGSIFYAESWALAHYLKLKDSREGTHRLADYLDLLHKNIDTVAAAAQAFGDLDQLQADLKKYVVNGDYGYLQLPGSTDVDESSFAVRTMTQTQADIARADFLAHDGRDTEARALLEAVLHDDPANVPAHEIMGFIGIRQHNLGEARQWCEQAIKLDPKSFLGQSCFALSSVEKGLPDAAGQAGIENSLRAAIKINPSFTPAYAGLAEFFAHRRQNDEALQWIQKAIQLDRDTVDFRIDEASILLQLNRNQDGSEALDLALKMAHTPEETAAVENMLQSAKQFEVEHVVVGKAIRSGARQTESEADLPGARCAIQCQRNPRRRCSRDSSSRYLLAATRVHRRGPSIQARRNLRRLAHGWYRWQAEQCCRDKKLGMGLDEKAVEALRKWKFEPARRSGRPVPARLSLSLSFKILGAGDKFLQLSEKAKTGDPAAEFELANAFFEGRDVPKDESQGLALLERAARDGLPQAQFQMAERTYGDGTNPDNYVMAYVWYTLAQRGSVEQSDTRMNVLEGQMSAEQLSDARKRLENWNPPPAK